MAGLFRSAARARRVVRVRFVWRVGGAALALALATGTGVFVSPGTAHADTVRGLQWYLDALRIPQAHKLTKGHGVVVAVIDSGVDASHPALKGQVLRGHGVGADAAPDGRRDQDAEKGHGTAMAGLIAGIGGSDMRQLGIAPEAKILPISLGARMDDVEMAEAVRWAVDNGADVINLSVGGGGVAGEGEVAAVRYALDKDVVVVASSGNREQGELGITAPANIPGVIAVTGTAKDGGFFAGSVQGPEAVLAAPQEKIIAPAPFSVSRNGYGVSSGTSDSAAIVSGVVALVRAKYPDLDVANVINRLIRTARDKGPNGRDPKYGFGLVDPVAALTVKVSPVDVNPLRPAATAATSERAVDEGDDDGSWIEIGVTRNPVVWAAQIGVCLLVVTLVVFLVVMSRRSARRRDLARPPAPPFGPPGATPSGAPWGGPPVHPRHGPPAPYSGRPLPYPGHPPPAGGQPPATPPPAPPPEAGPRP